MAASTVSGPTPKVNSGSIVHILLQVYDTIADTVKVELEQGKMGDIDMVLV